MKEKGFPPYILMELNLVCPTACRVQEELWTTWTLWQCLLHTLWSHPSTHTHHTERGRGRKGRREGKKRWREGGKNPGRTEETGEVECRSHVKLTTNVDDHLRIHTIILWLGHLLPRYLDLIIIFISHHLSLFSLLWPQVTPRGSQSVGLSLNHSLVG